MTPGWLVAQLPQVMRRDELMVRLVTAFEEVADGVVERIDGLEHQVDIALAPYEMLRYLASWIGLAVDPESDDDAQRELVRAIGRSLGWRGTQRGLEDLLTAATRSRVEVFDGGGIFGQNEAVPVSDNRIAVVIDDLGPLRREQVLAFCAAEVPIGAVVNLQVLSDDEGDPA
jgi:phage tail-like protein